MVEAQASASIMPRPIARYPDLTRDFGESFNAATTPPADL
jgi:hypothetical protein